MNPCIEILFRIGDLEALTLLHYVWIAELNPEIRRHILTGFKNIGDHRFIVDPNFPRMWRDAAMRFNSPEREQRLEDLEEYIPSIYMKSPDNKAL